MSVAPRGTRPSLSTYSVGTAVAGPAHLERHHLPDVRAADDFFPHLVDLLAELAAGEALAQDLAALALDDLGHRLVGRLHDVLADTGAVWLEAQRRIPLGVFEGHHLSTT